MFGIAKLKIGIVAIPLVLILIFAGIWYYLDRTTPPPPNSFPPNSPPIPSNAKISCPADVKICPDGTSVFRIPPKCEFVECPKRKSEVITKDNLKIYRNEELKVELTYSATKDYPGGQDEPDGYFNIGALGQFNANIDAYVKPDDYTVRKNFGSNPVITPLTIDGQEARMVNLSAPTENPRDDTAWVIIKYPKPIFLKNPTTGEDAVGLFLAIFTTRQFANDIVATMRFINR